MSANPSIPPAIEDLLALATQDHADLTQCEKVDLLEARMRMIPGAAIPGTATDLPLVHTFTPGIYARELRVPAGSLIVTKIHRTEHPYIVSKGHFVVWTAERGMVHIRAPFIGITMPGTRRVAYAFEDSVWTTIHANPTNERDLGKLEAEIIVPREHYIDPERAAKQLEAK